MFRSTGVLFPDSGDENDNPANKRVVQKHDIKI